MKKDNKYLFGFLVLGFLSLSLVATTTTEVVKEVNPKNGSGIKGDLRLIEVGNSVLITGELTGFKPNGKFGFHVHENPDCSNEGKAAGGHYAPHGHKHGSPSDDRHHKGDLGNIESDFNGQIYVKKKIPNANLNQNDKNSILNRSLIIHAEADDFSSQPSGDAGKRIGCVVVGRN